MCQGVPLIQDILESSASISKVPKYPNVEAMCSEEAETRTDRDIGMSLALMHEWEDAKVI